MPTDPEQDTLEVPPGPGLNKTLLRRVLIVIGGIIIGGFIATFLAALLGFAC